MRTVLATLVLLSSSFDMAEAKRPNVLLLVSDDQGYSDFGFTGSKHLRTPHLDRLAGESARFDNFVVAAACSPSRAALFTGREHLRTGVWGVPPKANLLPDEKLAPLFFREAGYRTMLAGKADTIGASFSSRVAHRGWDRHWMLSGGYEHENPKVVKDDHLTVEKGWTSELITDQLLSFISSSKDQPWFAVGTYIAPHIPLACAPEWQRPYLEAGLPPDLALCWGTIAQLDASIGRLLAGLVERGVMDDTIVVFLSDNGMSQKRSDLTDLPVEDWKLRNHHGLRGHKAEVFENGIRVPLLVRWPATVQAGARKQFATVEDVLPTLLDLAGITPAAAPLAFTGVSLRPVLADAAAEMEHAPVLRIAISGNGSPGLCAAWLAQRGIPEPRLRDYHLTLRGPRFKYHLIPGQAPTLYDLDQDPQETQDLATTHPKAARNMGRVLHEQWAALLATHRLMPQATYEIWNLQNQADPRLRSTRLDAVQAHSFTGQMKFTAKDMSGFTKAGDSITLHAEVRDAGSYRCILRGKQLPPTPSLKLCINGQQRGVFQPGPKGHSTEPLRMEAGATQIRIETTEDGSLVRLTDVQLVWAEAP